MGSSPTPGTWKSSGKPGERGRGAPRKELSQFPTPVAGAVPGSMALGADGNLWFTYENLTRLGRMRL